ncbi:hypothetical protein [Salinimicrobium flavum]|uniref:Uncharacterized protein n=1 Tax=Salinimicrobium flavum TaxID=1737065 RepID=A0ABW5IZS8_9FLAO
MRRTTVVVWDWMFILTALLIGLLIFYIFPGKYSGFNMVLFAGVPFYLFLVGFYGLVWRWIKPEGSVNYITHVLLMGLVFMILFFIHVYILLPYFCDGFNCLRP